MTRTQSILLAAGGSAALLAGAFVFQALGYAPCKLCLWQRWPHAVAVLIGVVALVLPGRLWPALGALAALTTSGLGLYHTGVERGWWLGPDTCTSGPVTGLSPEELLAQIQSAPLVRCDEVAWQLAGLSMASWNMILSFLLVLLWVMAARRPT
jgi:disulfide bond formation protein DsbB